MKRENNPLKPERGVTYTDSRPGKAVLSMLDRLDDTIVAVSSAPGYGLLGIVRLSGPKAISIADSMVKTAADAPPLANRPGASRVGGEVLIDQTLSLPATFYVFHAPHSYTRQDMVEIHTTGSPEVLELVRRRAIALGALAAEPGEFTARAFLSGAMDLPSAEAVAGVINAQTDTQLRAARRMMDGEFTRKIRTMRDKLGELAALVEADIDFSEEPIEFINPATLRDRLRELNDGLEPLLRGGVTVERLDVLPRVLLFGPPNSGKSTLMNRLSGISRAICATAAGTTRDILSAPVKLGDGEAILLDAAGVDNSQDEIIAQARARAVSEAERVDLVCVVVDVTAPDDGHLLPVVRSLDVPAVVVVANKSDLRSEGEVAAVVKRLEGWRLGPVCPVSAKEGAGMETLRALLAEGVTARETTTLGEAVVLSERQRGAVRTASAAIGRAAALCEGATETIDCADLLAFELREALDALGAVTGELTTEDLLAQVFANFCIGK